MKKKILIGLICICVAFSSTVFAQAFDERGYYDYCGSLNEKTNMTASLYSQDGHLTGGYVKDNSNVICVLSGSLISSKVQLKEFDSRHKAIAILEGTLGADEVIMGTRTDLKSGAVHNFRWSLQNTLTGVNYGHRYESAGFEHDNTVDNFAANIQKALKLGDKVLLSKSVQYPITVNINGNAVSIKNAKDFIKNYNGIFHPIYKKALLDTPARYMFANDHGVLFGSASNNLWIGALPGRAENAQPTIIAFNN